VLIAVYSLLRQGTIGAEWHFSLDGYKGLVQYNREQVILRTLKIGLIATTLLFILVLPTAYWLAKCLRSDRLRVALLVLLTVPFFLSEDSRSVIWQSVYNRTGLINTVLEQMNIVQHPISALLFTEWSIYLGMIPIYFAPMFFPIWLAMTLIDDEYIEAARDLGGSWLDLMKDIVLPLAAPGVVAGFLFTFVPMMGDAVVPRLLGGGTVAMISGAVQDLVTSFQYTVTAALSVVLSAIVAVLVVLLMRLRVLRGGFLVVKR
jgi:spermidine/putrescine transport system permease protein